MSIEITEEMFMAFRVGAASGGLEEALRAAIENGLESGAIQTNQFFHGLTPEELEALALMTEEAGEVVQAAMKIVRHGMHSRHPVTMADNKASLEKEIGDFKAVVKVATDAAILDDESIDITMQRKPGKLARFLHHLKIGGV